MKVIGMPYVGKPQTACTDSLFTIGKFDNMEEAVNLCSYIKTKFLRYLVSILKSSQNVTQIVYEYVPMQDFSSTSDIDWTQHIEKIDKQLYKKYDLTAEEIALIESTVKYMDEETIYGKMLNSSYVDIVKYLLNKYGAAKHDYFTDTACKVKNKLVSRTNEGLYCHHIDEDKAIMLSNDKLAAANPFEYQKANRLVYCNLLEHLLLHVKIAEEPRNADANENELPGIGGAVNFLCKELNDIYAGKEFAEEWRRKVADEVNDSFDDYIMILKHLWNIVEQNPLYKLHITKESLCVGYDGKIVPAVLQALSGDEE